MSLSRSSRRCFSCWKSIRRQFKKYRRIVCMRRSWAYGVLSTLGQCLIHQIEKLLKTWKRPLPDLPHWAAVLSGETQKITQEFHKLYDEDFREFGSISPEQRRITAGNSWKVYILKAYGRTLQQNALRCPHTNQLIRGMPQITTALFSVLEPETHVIPHRGPYAGVLRCHIPLIVPEGDCGIRVGDRVYNWQMGRPLIFDDTVEHEAWNRTSKRRVVLFIDFLRPLPVPLATLNKLMIWLIGHSPFIGRALRASL